MEQVFSDFSGGMNALAAVDKLDPKECLLAENVRLDETGNVQSAGAVTAQNTAAYAASGGTSTNNVHSLYWNPSFGAVAGVGQDVFAGRTLGGMSSQIAGKNVALQKMSFASAPNRVYFDLGSTGYWTDLTNYLLVDWPSPVAIGGTITGPTVPGTATQVVQSPFFTLPWNSPENLVSTSSFAVASITSSMFGATFPQALQATMSTSSFAIDTVAVTGLKLTIVAMQDVAYLGQWQVTAIKNGSPVGDIKVGNLAAIAGAFSTLTFGGSDDLWGTTWGQADVNSGTSGFQVIFLPTTPPGSSEVFGAQVTIYQGGGFVAGTGTTGVLSGSYTYKETFVAANGEESDASNPSNGVTLSNNMGTLTGLSTGDARTTARNIYRTGGALTSYYLVGTIQDNTTTTYTDNLSDLDALSEGVILAGDVPGDQPNTRLGNTQVRFPELHYDRVFWVNQGKTNQIIWSKPLNGFAYPAVNFIDVGDSKPISRIISVFGELIIVKTDSIWRLTGTDESSFDLTQTPSSIGTDLSFTAVRLPDKVPFCNRYGLWIFNGYTSQAITSKLDGWFKQQDRTGVSLFGVNGFHPPQVTDVAIPLNFEAVANSEKYVLAYARNDDTQNSEILILDLKHGNITTRTLSRPLSLAIDPVNGYVYVGDNHGIVSLLDDWNGADQDGSPANFDFQTGYFDLARGSNKALWALEFYINTHGQSLLPYVYYDGGLNSEVLPAISASGLQRIVRPVKATNSRMMQNFSVRLNGALTSVNVRGTPQVEIVHIKALFDVRTGRARTGQ